MTALRLTIDNHSALPDGGPLTYTLTGRRGMDIGRDPHLDWVLPDPARIVSGKHCEIRFRDGGYWLHDVSSNGTYLNGETARLPAPRRLRTGDRLEIGPYLISIVVDGAEDSQPDPARVFAPAPPVATAPADLWGIAEEVAPPARVDRARAARPLHNFDFIDSASDIPGVSSPRAAPADPHAIAVDWAMPAPPQAAPPVPPAGPEARLLSVPEPARASAPAVMPAPVQNLPVQDRPVQDQPVREQPVQDQPLPPPAASDLTSFVALFERGAGLPAGALQSRPPAELAEMLGRMMALMTSELKTLMQARSESKTAMRSASHTTVQALDNNPIPFAPTAEDALRLMLAAPGKSYLQGEAALRKTFDALKSHQMETFIAMQAALDGLLKELDPATIEQATEPDTGVGKLFTSPKARLWDIYRARWQALAATHPEGMRGAFMTLFTSRYDRGSGHR